ncbi:hypothetical protein V6N12_021145 [Hibiscus sabdariffa]|uniref:RNase H type-1 domain-containing protein n=1 Tax=Hibiscus sabdariffa TaxID=183260 RepID=A0ABR2ATA7_9ROSI
MWSCWLFRNEVVFKGIKVDVSQLFDLCIQRLSWWCVAKWPRSGLAINDLINSPSHFADFAIEQVTISKDTWCPPLLGELKFNVDGATLGSFGETGIGGCLRDVDSNCMITFSKSVGVTDCTSA